MVIHSTSKCLTGFANILYTTFSTRDKIYHIPRSTIHITIRTDYFIFFFSNITSETRPFINMLTRQTSFTTTLSNITPAVFFPVCACAYD